MSILITGHTGFKGFTLSALLASQDVVVHGFSNTFRTSSLYGSSTQRAEIFESESIGKIENFEEIDRCITNVRPQVIFHLAAQPIVSIAATNPMETFKVNAVGTGNLLESCRKRGIKSRIVVITTDKVYADNGFTPHKEIDELSSDEPYGASKVGAELVARSFRVLDNCENMNWATARAGNIVGFGDDGLKRLMPDLLNAKIKKESVFLRNPKATRPWTYVLDALMGYILLSNYLINPPEIQSFNFGPNSTESLSVLEIGQLVLGSEYLRIDENMSFYEQENLLLDSSLAMSTLNWKPLFDSRGAVSETLEVSNTQEQKNAKPYETLNMSFERYFSKADELNLDLRSKFDLLRQN
jgi:CDP-glucose 4,6-dehydratase